MILDWAGETFELRPERAVFWPRERSLIVADLHLGKAAAFRRAGVPVPEATTAATLQRLTQALREARPRRLLILGDLLHAREGRAAATEAAVADWRAAHASLEIILVRGNHDGWAGDPPPTWRVQCVSEPLEIGALALCHDPAARPAGRPALAGHVHPAVALRELGHRVRLPCFWFGPDLGLLPAFGAFTGSHVIRAAAGDRVFVVVDGEVHEPRSGTYPPVTERAMPERNAPRT